MPDSGGTVWHRRRNRRESAGASWRGLNGWRGGLIDVDADRLSYVAECLVADTYGLPRPPPDSYGHDLILPAWLGGAELAVNVKHAPHPDSGLFVPTFRPRLALAYLLVTGPEGGMVIRGFAWRHTLERAAVRDLGGGPAFYMRQSELHRTEMLMAAHGLTV